MMAYVWICLGSAVGGGCRYWISGAVAQRFGESFPAGTLLVNVSGSLIIGFLAALADSDSRFLLGPAARQFLMVGLLGGYTTFSSFSVQTLSMLRTGDWLYAGANVLFSVLLCLVAVWVGYAAGESLNLRN